MAKSKLTLDDIQRTIKNAQYYVFPGTTVTVCCLTTLHDFNVIGESACIDPAAFSESIGRTGAQQDAIRKIWALEAYLQMYKNAKAEDPVFAVSAINNPVEILTPDPEPQPVVAPVSVQVGEDPSLAPVDPAQEHDSGNQEFSPTPAVIGVEGHAAGGDRILDTSDESDLDVPTPAPGLFAQ